MTSPGSSRSRRRRRRAAAADRAAAAGGETATVGSAPGIVTTDPASADPLAAGPVSADPLAPGAPSSQRRGARPNRERVDRAERGLRDLVGAGPSQLGVSGALRGRDVNRPSEDDLAAAEADVVVVRRHWTPQAGRSDGSA